jgi:hypothetical protein
MGRLGDGCQWQVAEVPKDESRSIHLRRNACWFELTPETRVVLASVLEVAIDRAIHPQHDRAASQTY